MKYRLASLALLLCLTVGVIGIFCAFTPKTASSPPSTATHPTLLGQAGPTAEAKIVLVAPSTARIGELVRFDVSGSAADSFKWLLVPMSEDFLVYDSGARAVFSARTAGEYRFVIAVAKNGVVDVVTHVVRIIGSPTMPTTDDLATWVSYWVLEANLPKEECEKLAASFEAVAARKDELLTPSDWIKVTAKSNRAALGDRLSAWAPVLDKIGAELANRAGGGTLSTPEEHEKIWLEVAEGLRSG